ncbi:MAG: enolase C-terminal domain-like protein, partial [Pseudomonadota bacterium]
MKIAKIEVLRWKGPTLAVRTPAHRNSWEETDEVANPLSFYPRFKRHRNLWFPKTWEQVWCKVTLEDGTTGLGQTVWGRSVAALIEDHLAPNLIGENALDIERLADMMWRMTTLYGSVGLASYAVSAIDLALWDAKGRLLDKPVYALIGHPKNYPLDCYATGNDIDWYQELGFSAFKLACPYGPADGDIGIEKNDKFVARAREQVGEEQRLMLDCWMAFDVDYTIKLAQRLKPYNLYWLEECLPTEDYDAHIELRRRLPEQRLTTGEHWATVFPFEWAIKHDVVDILQPDIQWCGGLTTCLKIAELAEKAGKQVILHTGARSAYGQHFSYSSPVTPWLECYVNTAP